MALSNRDRVAESLGRLADGLAPFVARQLPEPVSAQDPATLLRAITEHDEFRAALSGTEIGFAHELLDVATRLSDSSLAFSEPDTQRALDTTERLLRAAGAAQEAEAVQESLTEFLRLAADRRSRKVDRASVILPGMEGLGLKPWRQVIRPHKDIVDGNFNASQFAANLYNVVNGKATLRVPGCGRVLPPHLPDRRTAGPAHRGRPACRRRHERLASDQPTDELRRRQDALDARAVPHLLGDTGDAVLPRASRTSPTVPTCTSSARGCTGW